MRVSKTISALNVREEKAWKVIDWAMSSACTNSKVKFQAAQFVLERLYLKPSESEPMKVPQITVKIEKADENARHQLQTPRFSVSSLQ